MLCDVIIKGVCVYKKKYIYERDKDTVPFCLASSCFVGPDANVWSKQKDG